MGMDIDGPQNDKGLYAIVPVRKQMSIGQENSSLGAPSRANWAASCEWGSCHRFRRTGAMSRPRLTIRVRGRRIYARRKRPQDLVENYYVANFKDYRFLQVFYPTRGILAWYSRESGKLQPLPRRGRRALRPYRRGLEPGW